MRVLLAVAVVVMGCGPAPLPGAPMLGSSCETTAKPECFSAVSLALCETNGEWIEVACSDRCSNEQSPRCDVEAVVGEPCPALWEGAADRCETARQMVFCQGGKWTTRECACQDNDGLITCR